ncbi:ACT domain-containing protein [Methanospirillum stamsii]|uniref:Acetolactate synthase n=1 Tax=Methanospirillum stamsii TaxID=1277351 RepID=A0A2V2MWX2_9EURY|nr:ACT domain-containing protein [Methanospirillum stamsii]PWR70730.1 acetolactate synthase [Methanospirillum stamsii]
MNCEQYMIRQISLFSENKPGRLAALAKACQEENVNILAFSIAEADGFGVIRVLVDKPDVAFSRLTALGFNVAFTHVIAVLMRDEPGGLFEIASKLSDAGINIDYSYAFSGKNKAILILRVDKVEEAIKLLLSHSFTLIATDSIQ